MRQPKTNGTQLTSVVWISKANLLQWKKWALKKYSKSVTKYTLYYTSFYDDGDSKAFPVLENAYVPEKPVQKY